MRHRHAVLLCLALAPVAAVAAGCERWFRAAEEERDPLVLKTMSPGEEGDRPQMYRVRIVRLRHRRRPDAPVEDTWRLLGTTSVSHEKSALWEANDLRLGEGAQMASERLNELLAETADRAAKVTQVVVRENLDFVVTVGRPGSEVDVVWSGPAGRLAGRHFEDATPQFRFVCRRSPDDPKAVCIALSPEVSHGQERMRYVRTEHGFTQRMAPDVFAVPHLEAEVRLEPGRLLVVGGRRTSPVSVGGAFLYEVRGPDLWQETLLVTARRVPAEALPPPGRRGRQAPASDGTAGGR